MHGGWCAHGAGGAWSGWCGRRNLKDGELVRGSEDERRNRAARDPEQAPGRSRSRGAEDRQRRGRAKAVETRAGARASARRNCRCLACAIDTEIEIAEEEDVIEPAFCSLDLTR